MPHPGYIHTPQTAADISSLTNNLAGLDGLSPEKSFASPSKGRDLFNGMKNGRGASFKTPRVGGRDPLRLLPNGVGPKGEFTPLLMSVTKKNHMQRASARKLGAKSPYLSKDDSALNGNTPGLPRIGDSSNIYDERTTSSTDDAANRTPLPQIANGSSAQSTPLAQLPGRDGRGGVVGDGNVMTLREQENIIDRIDKENFGLKLKVYLLENAMAQRGKEFNQVALKENTDLKVDRITMQRELHKFRKIIAQAEKDAEIYRLQLAEYRERMKREQTDETIRIETERLQNEVETKESEIFQLRDRVHQLEQELDNLQASLEEEKEKIETQMGKDIDGLEAQLKEVHEERDSLKEQLMENDIDSLEAQLKEVHEERDILKEQLMEKDIDGLEAQLKEVHEERDSLKEQLMEKEQGDETGPLERERLQLKLETKQSEIGQLQEQVQQLEEEVEVLQDGSEEDEEKEQQQRERIDSLEAQLREVKDGKQSLQDQLGSINIQLHELKNTAHDVEAERDELEARLLKVEKPADDTFNVDHEKRELQRSKQRLEMEVARLREERDTLQQGNMGLKMEMDAEAERASAEEHRLRLELDSLRNRQLTASDNRDRELTSAKNSVQRLEKRIGELEELVENQSRNMPSTDVEGASGLRDELGQARRKEAASLQREATLKTSSRDLKSKVANLEREIHDLNMSRLNIPSKSPGPSPSSAKELATTRRDLLDAQTTLRDLRARNQDLEHQASKGWVDEAERADLHELVKSSSLESEALSLKLSERDTKVKDLRAQLKRLRGDRENAQAQTLAASQQLNALQEQHKNFLDKAQLQQQDVSPETVVRQKELRGLTKEVVWLRARCRREEEFRRDLAWSKGFMELGEGIRAACTQAELRMIQEMGVRAPARSSYESRLAARQRLRAAVYAVVAANRMMGMEKEWRGLKKMGESLKRRREGQKGCAGVRSR